MYEQKNKNILSTTFLFIMLLKTIFFEILCSVISCTDGNNLKIMDMTAGRNSDLEKCLAGFLYSFRQQSDAGWTASEDIVTNFDLHNEKIVRIVIGPIKNETFDRKQYAKVYAFDLSTSEEFILQYLKSNRFINRRATFIFFQEHLDPSSFEKLRTFFVKTVFIVDRDLDMYTIDPYSNGDSNESIFSPIFLGRCEDAEVYLREIKHSKITKKWPNTTLKIFFRDMPPFVDHENTGFEQNILKVATRYLQMKNQSQIDKVSYEPEKTKFTGTYKNKVLRYLQHDKADVILGAFHTTEDTEKDFDGSVVYITDSLNIVAPKSHSKSVWRRVLEIYSPIMSFLYLGTVIITAIFIHCLYKIRWLTTLSWLLQMTIDSPIYKIQKSGTVRLVLASYMIFCLIDSTVFKNTLQLIYFSKSYEQGIFTKAESLASGLTVYTFNEHTILEYKRSTVKELREVGERMTVCADVVTCLDRIAHKRDAIMLFLKLPVIFAIPKYYVNPKNNEPLITVGESFQMIPVQMIFRKYYPPFEDINRVLTRILEGGVLDFEARKKRWDWNLKVSKLDKLRSKVLTLRHLNFVCFIWVAGVCVALVAFLGELIKFYYFSRGL